MSKLNNEGWGVLGFFLMLVILIIALAVVAHLTTKAGLVKEDKNNYKHTDFSSQINDKYSNYENTIADTAKEYISANNINYDVYINIKFLNIPDTIKNECTGYIKKASSAISTFIYCGTYQTPGYDTSILN